MRFGPLPGKKRALPILCSETSQYFVHPDAVDPWRIGDSKYVTSALKFGAQFDLLSLSADDDLYVMGEMSITDVLDPDMSIDRLYYRTKYGDVSYIQLADSLYHVQFDQVKGNRMEWQLDMAVKVNKFGEAKSWLSKLVDKTYKFFFADPTVTIRVMGTVNLQTGIVQIDAVTDNFEIRPIGYTLRAYRFDMNRQPGKCPYMEHA
jgi:hypothetical protein